MSARSRHRLALLAALLVAAGAVRGRAQYEGPASPQPADLRLLYAGAMFADFAPRSSSSAPDSTAIAFTTLMPVLGYSAGPADLTIGYARYSLRGETRSAVSLGLAAATDLPLVRGGGASVSLPVLVVAGYLRADNTGSRADDFNVGSVGIGAGLRLRTESGFSLVVAQSVQYAFEGFDWRGGVTAATSAEAMARLLGTGPFEGLAVGYRFRYQFWSMNDAALNYRLVAHGPVVGVMF